MKDITTLVRKQIRTMDEVNWGDIPDNSPFRLLWGENQQVLNIYKKAILDEIKNVQFYPSPTKIKLKKAIAKYNSVEPHSVIPTNGSDEALELIAKVFINKGDDVIIPSPSYPCFESVSKMMGASVINVNLEKDFSLNINKLLAKVTKKTKIVWIANPNNPTGNILVEKNEIEKLVNLLDCLIVLDECYYGISAVTATNLTKKYENLIVTRSFTKVFSLAGVRLGYIIANSKTSRYMNKLQQNNQVFNVNRFAIATGIEILSNKSIAQKSINNFKKLKNDFEKLLKNITAIEIIPTQTTFCLLKLPSNITGKELKEKLSDKNILIKDCSIYSGFGSQYAYLGIPGTEYQMKVASAIKDAVRS